MSHDRTSEALLAEVRSLLEGAGLADADREARSLVAAAGARGEPAAATELARRRAAGAPLGQLVGTERFMGLTLLTSPGVLVPREETELLARTALSVLGTSVGEEPRVADLCCGAGNLACALAVALPSATVHATDLTRPCTELARRNVAMLGLQRRVRVERGDLFEPLRESGLAGTLDAVVCNPPYISTARLSRDRAVLLDHEPREAFDGGPYGLTIHQRVIREAPDFLRPGGWLFLEIGAGQERPVELLIVRSRAYEEPRFALDGDGAPRVAYARTKGTPRQPA